MRKLFTAATAVTALLGTGCASRVVVDPGPVVVAPAIVAPAPAVVVAPPRRVVVAPVCGVRTVRVVRPNGRVVFRRQRVCA